MKGNIFVKILNSEPVKKTVTAIVSNAPKILTGISIASSITAVGFTVKGTILAVEIEKKRKEKIESGEIPKPEHPKLEVVKSVWKCYIPAFAFLSASIGSSLYGTNISATRTAMASAACKATEMAFDEYKTKVAKQIGAEKEQKIRDDIERDHVDQYANGQQTLLVSPYEKYLCKDKYSGVMFMSDLNEIKDIFNKINYELIYCAQDELSMSSYLDWFGQDSNEECIGWNVSKTGLLRLSYELGWAKDGRPVLIFGPDQVPYEHYNMYG